jgi:xanthine/CO dehydrogenase XdhC/CoxF family maturation factor
MNCPVGLAAIKGKAPERVALSIAAQLAIWLDEDEHEAENEHADLSRKNRRG